MKMTIYSHISFCKFCVFSSFLLQMRRNLAKLELYRKFTNALAVCVLLSIAWIGFEVISFIAINNVMVLTER